jgi:hypothetical protein
VIAIFDVQISVWRRHCAARKDVVKPALRSISCAARKYSENVWHVAHQNQNYRQNPTNRRDVSGFATIAAYRLVALGDVSAGFIDPVLVVPGFQGATVMDSGAGGGFDSDDSWAYTPHLPAIIPPARPPIAVPAWRRFTVPHWRLFLVAALASGLGIGSATLWPLQTKLGAVGNATPPGHDIASHDIASHDIASHDPASRATAPTDGAVHPAATHNLSPAINPAPATTPPSTIRMIATPSPGIDGEACRAGFPAPQLVVSGPPTVLPAETPAVLGVAVDGAADGARVIICGFASKSVFSAGRSIDDKTWTMPVSDLGDATLIPPRGFVGPMKLIIALVNADRNLADRRALHLQWLPPSPNAQAMPRIAEVNEQLEEGKRHKAAGNLAAARALFLRLAQDGDSRAAFLLAETYDPIALAKHQLLPPDSDIEKARLWYRRASEHGSSEANGRLERLSNW